MKCNKDYCQQDASWEVRLSIAVNNKHEPSISSPVLFLCNEHKDGAPTFKQQAMTKNENGRTNWDNLCESLEAAGKQRPVMKYCSVIIQPIKVTQLELPDAK